MTVWLHLVGLLKTLINLGNLLNAIGFFFFQIQITISVCTQYPDSESIQERCWKINDESIPQTQGIKLSLHALWKGAIATRLSGRLGWRQCLPSSDNMTLLFHTKIDCRIL